MQRYIPVAWAGGKAECHKDDRGEYVLHSDAQSRIAELEAEVAKWRDQCLEGDVENGKLLRDLMSAKKTTWNDAIDAAASLQINGMDVVSPVAKAYILALRR